MHLIVQYPSRQSKKKNKRKSSQSLSFFQWIKSLVILVGIGLLIIFALTILVLLYLRSQALPQITLQQTSQIVDRHGRWMDSFYNEQNRSVVRLADISPKLIKATLAIEDHRFYQHFGVDMKAIVRAALVNLEHGKMVQGAGTITQQLARNSYLSHERTWTRKWQETLYALQLELQYSKQDILEKYLNRIYYGHATYGIEMASQLYFGKPSRDLNLAESAMLAGIPKGPLFYSPYINRDKAKQRQQLVLQTMVTHQYISQQEADIAIQEPLQFQSNLERKEAIAPYFRDYVKSQALHVLGVSEEQLQQSGVKIYTSLDLEMQKCAEHTINKYMQAHPELQVALVAIDPRDGNLKAMVGGRDYVNNQFNRVFSQSRQPGSSFKPIVYLASLLAGHTPLTAYKSEPTSFTYDDGKKTYVPQNFANTYANRDIQMRQAIAKSDNIYAVHTLLAIGTERVIKLAKQLGISNQLQALPSLALGSSPISPFDLARAYSVIANQGVKVEPVAILKIENANGETIYKSNSQFTRVVDAAPTYVLTHLMQSVFSKGATAHRVAHLIKRPVAAKTGSTNADSWMVGFTPELSTAVWVGYDKDRTIGSVESHLASPIFAEFTELALEKVEAHPFPQPEGVIALDIDPVTGKMANAECPKSKPEVFVIGTQPTEYCAQQPAEPSPSSSPEQLPKKKEESWWDELIHWWTT